MLVPIVIGALGTVSERFHMYLKKAGLDRSILPLQKTCLLYGNIKNYKKGDGFLRWREWGHLTKKTLRTDNKSNNNNNNNYCYINNYIVGVMELCEQLLPSRVYAAYSNTSTADEINTMCRMCGKVPESLAHVLAGCSSQTKYVDTQA